MFDLEMGHESLTTVTQVSLLAKENLTIQEKNKLNMVDRCSHREEQIRKTMCIEVASGTGTVNFLIPPHDSMLASTLTLCQQNRNTKNGHLRILSSFLANARPTRSPTSVPRRRVMRGSFLSILPIKRLT